MKILILTMLLSFNVFAEDITLTSENTVSLLGPVNGQSMAELMRDLNEVSKLGEEKAPIYLVLNTPGGSVFAGLELMQYINTLRRPVHVVANFAASMGFHILQNSPKRYITKMGTIMSHRASGSMSGELPEQISSRLKHINSVLDKMDENVVRRTNGRYTKRSYQELTRPEYWAVGQDAINDGFADDIANLKCDSSLDGTKTVFVQTILFEMEVEISKCPLITLPLPKKVEDTRKVQEYFSRIKE